MKKAVVLASAVALAATTFSAGTASASGFSEGFGHFRPHHHHRHHHFHHHHKVKTPAAAKEGGSSSNRRTALGNYVLFSTFCAATSLIVQSAYVGETEHRELTSREAFYTTGNCFLPIVGGPLFWALANNGNPD